jgi:transposase-like protein
MGVRRACEDRRLLGIHGACPRCGVEQEFRVGGRFFDGRTFDCQRCHNNLRLQ